MPITAERMDLVLKASYAFKCAFQSISGDIATEYKRFTEGEITAETFALNVYMTTQANQPEPLLGELLVAEMTGMRLRAKKNLRAKAHAQRRREEARGENPHAIVASQDGISAPNREDILRAIAELDGVTARAIPQPPSDRMSKEEQIKAIREQRASLIPSTPLPDAAAGPDSVPVDDGIVTHNPKDMGEVTIERDKDGFHDLTPQSGGIL